MPQPSAPRGRAPYSGIWLDDFTLTAVRGGALLAGGQAWQPDGGGTRPQTMAEAAFFDATRKEWVSLPLMPSPRQSHAAVSLPDGRALLIGGRSQNGELASTVFWEPETRQFREGPPLAGERGRPVAVTLPDGSVMVLGSDFDNDMERGTRAELLRPGAKAWEPAGQTVRIFHVGPVCVTQNHVLIAGGRDNGMGFAIYEGVHIAPPLAQSTEVWSLESRTWRTAPGSLLEPRDDHQGITLADGRVLVVGGWHKGHLQTSAELWDPRTEQWSRTGALSLPRSSFTLTALPDGRAVVSGGLAGNASDATTATELWDPQKGTWSPGAPLAIGRAGHLLVPMDGDTFLVVGTSRPTPEALETTWELWSPGG
ncbi:Kelch repeat-containing protein [Hyalangium minutum]|uniref:Uncharacterized protein n=1 Tax=Hyalangium minutum TaxID=394096 RepID=A0A085WS28_9BACT|nr:kelch repeat-containing protein [Hyalangium minutum]KFE70491.1 hypothetical protein DB31_5533 [Hyalangium minutum]